MWKKEVNPFFFIIFIIVPFTWVMKNRNIVELNTYNTYTLSWNPSNKLFSSSEFYILYILHYITLNKNTYFVAFLILIIFISSAIYLL
jgi:hypothetical protein